MRIRENNVNLFESGGAIRKGLLGVKLRYLYYLEVQPTRTIDIYITK